MTLKRRLPVRKRTALALLLSILASASACDLLPSSAPTIEGTRTPAAVPGGTARPSVEDRVDGYLAVAPRIMRSAQTETVSVAIFNGDRPANGTVQVVLLKDGSQISKS